MSAWLDCYILDIVKIVFIVVILYLNLFPESFPKK